MNNVWSEKIDSILSIGQSLSEIGIRNWALIKAQALNALKQFASAEIAVLGGDVYDASTGKIRSSYANWYCDRLAEEKWEDFVKRSIAHARSYIENYGSKNKQSASTLFSMTPADPNS